MSKLDIITSIIKESEAYSSMSLIEAYIERGVDLSMLPAQPLYLCLKSMPVAKVSKYLSHFSPEQRKVFYNLDLWSKDFVNPTQFEFWLKANTHLQDDALKSEFVLSEEFSMFLKSRFNVWTFDVEDPQYPDHDNYFLTDDNLLLFEFEENYEHAEDAKELIKHLYYTLGVDDAYSYLFKLVQDSYSNVQEDAYQNKKELLRDYGFVDYYEALALVSPFPNLAVLENYIKKKAAHTGEIDIVGKKQALHNKSLISFKDKMDFLRDDLQKIADEKRQDFLQFNFIQLVNGTFALKDSLQAGPVAMTKTGEVTRKTLELGYGYVKNIASFEGSIFEKFEFVDLYRIGHSLIHFVQKDIKKCLEANGVESDQEEAFLGAYWMEFLDLSFEDFPKVIEVAAEKPNDIRKIEQLVLWRERSKTFTSLLPFIKKFHETFEGLKEEGVVQDNYYMNYSVEEIDFEAILLSSLANFHLGNFAGGQAKKLGLSLDELKKFAQDFLNNDVLNNSEVVALSIEKFISSFGLDGVPELNTYILQLLKSHLEGYDYENLADEDFKHVGGPIILTLFQ